MAARKIVRRSCLGARPRYNLVVDEDVKKPNKPNQSGISWGKNDPETPKIAVIFSVNKRSVNNVISKFVHFYKYSFDERRLVTKLYMIYIGF